MDGCKKIIFLVMKNIVAQCYTRSNKFGDTSLYELLCQLWVFELVADGNTSTSTYKLWKVCVESMVRKSRHSRIILLLTTSCTSFGECNAKNVGCYNSIVGVCLIEVATTKKKQCIRMFGLEIQKLPHHWSYFVFGLCHE